jgi:hypothetical protein
MGSSETTVSSDKEKIKMLEQKLAEMEARQEKRRRFGEIPAGRDEGKRFFTTVVGRAVVNWAKNTLFTHVKFVPENGGHVNGNV